MVACSSERELRCGRAGRSSLPGSPHVSVINSPGLEFTETSPRLLVVKISPFQIVRTYMQRFLKTSPLHCSIKIAFHRVGKGPTLITSAQGGRHGKHLLSQCPRSRCSVRFRGFHALHLSATISPLPDISGIHDNGIKFEKEKRSSTRSCVFLLLLPPMPPLRLEPAALNVPAAEVPR